MNPFKKDNQMLPIASINSVYVDDVLASDLFRPSILIDEILNHKKEFGIKATSDTTQILLRFNELLNDELDTFNNKALSIAEDFGNRLAKVLVTLRKPSLKSISNRKNWKKIHWDYWKRIQNIYLVGGLTSPILTKIFYSRIMESFEEENINNLNITFIEGSQNLGTKGLATEVENGRYLLFDFGQTKIKRAYHVKSNGKTDIDNVLSVVDSKYLFYKNRSDDEIKKIALKLHNFIKNTIIQTMKEVNFKGDSILISIANYVFNGAIYSERGGYGKLSYLGDNYETILSESLSKHVNKKINIKLYHDTSAMALLFRGKPDSAVISLGTAFGVAFPN